MPEIKISATDICEIITDESYLDSMMCDLEEVVGDSDGAYICTGETLLALIEDNCDDDTYAHAKTKLKGFTNKNIIINAGSL